VHQLVKGVALNTITGEYSSIPRTMHGTSGSPCVDFSRLRSKQGQLWFDTCVRDVTGESGRGYGAMLDVYHQEGVLEFANENVPKIDCSLMAKVVDGSRGTRESGDKPFRVSHFPQVADRVV
jgi:uncharacterized protein (UPF0261 family)